MPCCPVLVVFVHVWHPFWCAQHQQSVEFPTFRVARQLSCIPKEELVQQYASALPDGHSFLSFLSCLPLSVLCVGSVVVLPAIGSLFLCLGSARLLLLCCCVPSSLCVSGGSSPFLGIPGPPLCCARVRKFVISCWFLTTPTCFFCFLTTLLIPEYVRLVSTLLTVVSCEAPIVAPPSVLSSSASSSMCSISLSLCILNACAGSVAAACLSAPPCLDPAFLATGLVSAGFLTCLFLLCCLPL
jgi:hypothetical protein